VGMDVAPPSGHIVMERSNLIDDRHGRKGTYDMTESPGDIIAVSSSSAPSRIRVRACSALLDR
jgi:hypothetical protein